MKKLALLIGLFSILLIAGSAKATTYTCDSCASCQSAMGGAIASDIVQLNSSFSTASCQNIPFIGISNTCIVPNTDVTLDGNGFTITGGVCSIGLWMLDNSIVRNITFTNFSLYDIFIWGDNNIVADSILNSTATHNLRLYPNVPTDFDCTNNTISNVTAKGGKCSAIFLSLADNNYIINSEVSDAGYDCILFSGLTHGGLWLAWSNGNTIQNLTSHNNTNGVFLFAETSRDSTNNIISDSNIFGNDVGIFIKELDGRVVSGNYFYNNIINNTENFNITTSSNYWNTTISNTTNIVGGTQLGGNYWAYPNGTGFSQTCNNSNADSFCDDSLTLGSGNTDFLPLNFDITIPIITIYSPQNTSYATTSIDLQVSADEAIDTWWYSLNGGTNISFSPNTTIIGIQGSNDIIVYANDSAGNEGSASVFFFVDSIDPTISWNTPSNNSFTANVSTILWNASTNEAPSECLLSVNGAGNVSMLITGNDCYYTSTNLTNTTTYCGLIYANDSFGNLGVSGAQCATINLTSVVTPPEEPSLISNLGMFGSIALLIFGAGIILFLLEAMFSANLRNPKGIMLIIIGAILMASMLLIFLL